MFAGILQQTYFQNSVSDYLFTIATLVFGALVIVIFKYSILSHLKRLTLKTKSTMDDFVVLQIEKAFLPLAYFGVIYLATHWLSITAFVSEIIKGLGLVLITVSVVRFVISVIQYALELFWLRGEEDVAKRKSLGGILTMVRVIVWGLGLVFLLDNLGFKVSSVLAGLGVGGVAVALAAQAVLGDLFSYLSIFFDRPFEIGDFIIVDDYLGCVENIGIKTTRIKSLSGEQLVFSNSDLTSSRVKNYKRMEERRVVFKFGVVYETSLQRLKEIPKMVKKIIEDIPEARYDRAHFFEYGNFSLDFEVVYYVLSGDYNKYMDLQQEINFAIKEEFERFDIEFAFPTQTVHLAGR